jgi:hypothetical protein
MNQPGSGPSVRRDGLDEHGATIWMRAMRRCRTAGSAWPDRRFRHRRRRARPRVGGGGVMAAGRSMRVLSLLRRSARARPPRDRSPDEALHEAPGIRPDRRRHRPRRVQRRHRLPHRAGPAPALGKACPARAAAARSPGEGVRRGDRSPAEGEPGSQARSPSIASCSIRPSRGAHSNPCRTLALGRCRFRHEL